MISFILFLGAMIAEPGNDCEEALQEMSLVPSWYDDRMLANPHFDACIMQFIDSKRFSSFAEKLIAAAAQGDHTEEVVVNLFRIRSRTDGYYAQHIHDVLEDLIYGNSRAIALYVDIDSVAGKMLKDHVAHAWCLNLPAFLDHYEPYVGSATAGALVAEAKKRLAECVEGEL